MKGFLRMLYMQVTTRPKPPPDSLDLYGQTALVTGASGGLGLEAAKDLAGRKIARLILCARSVQNQEHLIQQIALVNPNCNVEVWAVDYESYDSMLAFGKKAASSLENLHIAILSAGVRQLEYKSTSTGHEQNLQVNHLGTALLSLLLLPKLQSTASKTGSSTRMTIVSSMVHWWTPFSEREAPRILARMDENASMQDCSPEYRYATTKLLNVLWTRELASRLGGASSNVVVNTVDPGLCKSNLLRYENRTPIHVIAGIVGWTSAQGGHNIANAAVAQGPESHGKYVCSEQAIREPSDFVVSEDGRKTQVRIWDETLELFRKEVSELTIPAFASN